MDNPTSRVERVKLQGRETVTHLADVDDLIVHRADGGGLVIEFVRYDKAGKPLESFRVTTCPEDAERVRKA
jgi:hypothetical protein